MADVTQILDAIERGDPQAAEELLPLVYEELRRLAAHKMSQEPPGQTLQATALVHEAYIRLVGPETPKWSNRAHFFNAAAEAMRRILIDNIRRKESLKHGGNRQKVEINDEQIVFDQKSEDLIELDEALEKLAKKDKIKADLVKLRFFCGLTGEQAAELLNISHNTADKYWAYARAWLRAEITKNSKLK